MNPFRHILHRYQISRRSVSMVTLITYAALVFGLPMPVAARKSTEQPYPCQGNRCGCLTAEQCWRSCCCTTPGQRFAWAREHGVTPPDYAERPSDTPKRPLACCSHESKSITGDNAPASEVTFVLGIAALKCQGGTAMWTTAGLAPNPSLWFAWTVDAIPLEWLAFPPLKAISVSSCPTLPPPKA
jgi:hypothetical protein